MIQKDISEWGRRTARRNKTASASGPGGATVSARLSIGSHTFLRPQQSIFRARDCPPGEDFNLVSFRHCMGAGQRGGCGSGRGAGCSRIATPPGVRTRPERASLPREVPAARSRLRSFYHPRAPLLLAINNSGYAASAYVGQFFGDRCDYSVRVVSASHRGALVTRADILLIPF